MKRLRNSSLLWAGLACSASLCTTQSVSAQVDKSPEARAAEDTQFWNEKLKPFLKKHCVECHQGEEAEAGIDFAIVDEKTPLEKQRPRWNQVRGLIEIGAMPPPDFGDLPSMETREEIAAWIDRRINTVDCNIVTDPGRVTMRRLNNKEYDNTVRDLFGVEDFSVSSIVAFPSDGVGNGFDNQGDVLTLSPLQLEKYLQAAKTVADRIITTDRESLRRQRGDGGQIRLKDKRSARFLFAEGEYEVGARMEFGDNKEQFAGVQLLIDGEVVETFEVGSERKKYEKKLPLKAGWHELTFVFDEDKHADPERRDFRRALDIEYISMEGPKDGKPALPLEHERLFVATPADEVSVEQAAEKIFAPLIRRAFRRQPTELEVSRVVNLVKLAKNEGESFESAVGIGLQSVLVSPHFLFRIESEPAEPTKSATLQQPLSDDALASRLSYFLWASAPDDALLDNAAAGQLRDVAQIEAAAKRMLTDKRSNSLVTEFFLQTLGIGALREVSPDGERFPMWNDRLREAMRHETELVCGEILSNDRSLMDLLRADFTYINPRMAEFYGMEFKGASGDNLYRRSERRPDQDRRRRDGRYPEEDEWIRVSLPKERQGVLTHASILTLTSNPRETSPVKRGKWILENILGDPPPAAPPNVPSFDETKKKHEGLTLRKQLAIHRENASCASCHRIMDPLGLGFENFDPIGRWRETDRDQPIDASGELATGEKFSGAKELALILTERERQIARHFTSKLLTYALGRGLEPYDNCTVDKIMARAEKDNYRMSTIIAAIVSSDPFRLRRGIQESPQ